MVPQISLNETVGHLHTCDIDHGTFGFYGTQMFIIVFIKPNIRSSLNQLDLVNVWIYLSDINFNAINIITTYVCQVISSPLSFPINLEYNFLIVILRINFILSLYLIINIIRWHTKHEDPHYVISSLSLLLNYGRFKYSSQHFVLKNTLNIRVCSALNDRPSFTFT
jgi:hypothetical protein